MSRVFDWRAAGWPGRRGDDVPRSPGRRGGDGGDRGRTDDARGDGAPRARPGVATTCLPVDRREEVTARARPGGGVSKQRRRQHKRHKSGQNGTNGTNLDMCAAELIPS